MRRLLKKIRLLGRRRRLEQDLEDELRFHLEMKTEASGNQSEAARRLGNSALLKEQCRELWTFASLETLWQDIRYAVRTLGRTPGFVLAAILALSFGIGANTAVFTIVKGALTWNLGLDHVDRFVLIEFTDPARHRSFGVSWPEFRDLASQAKAFAGVGAYQFRSVNLADDRSYPERSWCATMSASGFSTSEQMPALGRVFTVADEQPGAPAVVVLSNHIWEDRYGRDRGMIGRTIRVNDVPSTVIGVMPPRKRFPEDADLWTPLVPDAQLKQRGNRSLTLFARLADGVSLATARAELAIAADRLAHQYPGTNKNLTLTAQPILAITGAYSMRPIFAALWVAVGFVLLIACADVANMLLARGAARRREIAVRVALGAGRFRIVRQLLIESALLSIVGGCTGWLVALAGLRWFEAALHSTVKTAWLNLSLDRTAFLYLAGISIGSGILFGLVPAFRLAKVEVHTAMKDGGQGIASSRRVLSMVNGLIALQMALSIVLLAGAGLMIRSAVNLYAAPTGVDTANVLTMHVSLPQAKYAGHEREIAFHRALKERLSSISGVESTAIVSRLPLGGFSIARFEFEKGAADTEGAPTVGAIVAGPGYFRTMRVHPRGREFVEADGMAGSPVALINESFARRYSPDRDSIGKQIRIFREGVPLDWMTVVGVVPDILQNFQRPLQHDPLVYVPYAFEPQREMYVVSRSGVAPAALLGRFRAAVKELDPNLAIYDAGTLEDRLAQNRLQTTLLGGMFTVFAAIALALSAIGLYAVIARSIQQRTQEIGGRMALGGTRGAILTLVFAQGLRPMLIGLATGLPCALLVTRVLRMALVGVSPGDPVTFSFAVLALALAGALGCALPARRALGIEPTVALRYE